MRYISPMAAEEKIIISVDPGGTSSSPEDKRIVEMILTKKHRGEHLTKELSNQYVSAMKRIGSFRVTVVPLVGVSGGQGLATGTGSREQV
jgi:hypothetical protein